MKDIHVIKISIIYRNFFLYNIYNIPQTTSIPGQLKYMHHRNLEFRTKRTRATYIITKIILPPIANIHHIAVTIYIVTCQVHRALSEEK